MILCGDCDNELAIGLAKKWNVTEKKSVFSTICNAGHCANMDNPDEFNAILRGFIETGGFEE